VNNLGSITGGIVWDNTNAVRLPALSGGRLFFGNSAGEVHALYLYPPTWTLGTNFYRVTPAGGANIQSMPLVQDGVLYLSSSNGRLYLYDADGGAGPALMTTYTLFANAGAGDLSRDSIGSGRIYVGTSAGRVYAITPPTDPTPAVP
jgi:outer membrane protein assembly factor BamB